MTFDPTTIGLATGAAGLALVTLVLLGLLAGLVVRRSRREARAAADPAQTSDELVAQAATSHDVLPEPAEAEPTEPVEALVAEPVPAGTELAAHDHSLLVRSLRAQVRTLEQTIEDLREVTDRIPATDPAEVPADEEPATAYRRQVALTVRALAGRPQPGESAEHALARVAAAIERLDGSDRLVRPVLPAVTASTVLPGSVQAAPAAPAAPAARPIAAVPDWRPEPAVVAPAVVAPAAVEPVLAQPAAPVLVAEETAEEALVAPVDDTLVDTAAADLDDQPEVVLPVPPPLVEEPRRNRRWLRRHAA